MPHLGHLGRKRPTYILACKSHAREDVGAAQWAPDLSWCTKPWFTKAAGEANSWFTNPAGEPNSWFTKTAGEPNSLVHLWASRVTDRLSNPSAKKCKEQSISTELPKRTKTSRCGGVASAFSIVC